jgi:hypothetical protein
MKGQPDVLDSAENESGSAKHENGTLTPSVPLKISQRAENMKIGHDALGTAENELSSVKHEKGTRRPLYRRKCVRESET